MRFLKGSFSEQYNVTVGVEYASKIVSIDEKTFVRLQIWDTAGQQLFKAVVRSFYKGIAAVFLLYSINSHHSFEQLRSWMREIKQHGHEEIVIFLIGAKADLQDQREVQVDQASSFLKQIGAVFFIETSSKTGDRIELLFNKASDILYKKFISNGAFRNLVRPVMASEVTRSQSLARISTSESRLQKRKKCC